MKHIILIIIVVLFAVAQVPGVPEEGADAKSSASKGWSPPPAGYTYQVSFVSGIRDYVVCYNDKLMRGGDITLKGGGRLKDFGIKTFITIEPDPKQLEIAKKAGLEPVTFLLPDTILPKKELNAFLKILKEKKGGFYIHSTEKNARAGVLGAAQRIFIEGWSHDKALVEFGRLGGDLKDYDRMLRAIKPR